MYTIDVNEEFVSIGKKYWEKAGISNKITSILRSAVDVTKEMLKEHEGTFDIAYLDVPKEYYEVVSKKFKFIVSCVGVSPIKTREIRLSYGN